MIKKFFMILLTLIACTNIVLAQAIKDSTSTQSDNVMYKTVEKNLNIKDKIIVQNKSPYLILQIMVALPNETEGFTPIGSSSYIAANEAREIASYDNNSLKFLRGKTIAIKIKGAKIAIPENKTQVYTPYGSVDVQHKEIDPNIINNIKDKNITYNFDVKLFETNHDLYLQVNYKGKDGTSIMDF